MPPALVASTRAPANGRIYGIATRGWPAATPSSYTHPDVPNGPAEVAELADAPDSKSGPP